MKKALLLIMLAAACLPAEAQLKLGLRMGVSTFDLPNEEQEISGAGAQGILRLSPEEARYGIHGGLIVQAQIGGFLLQPEVLFNSNRVDFRVVELQSSGFVTTIVTEKYQNVDIPLLLGARLGPLHVQAGPVAHIFVNSSSGLFDFPSYEQRFEEATFGWVAGLGLDLWNLMLDVRYEGNFSKFGEHITFNGQQYAFSKSPSRILLSVGILFGKR